MSISLVLALVAGFVSGAVVALKVIAPKTATTKDDAILARLEALEKLVKSLSDNA